MDTNGAAISHTVFAEGWLDEIVDSTVEDTPSWGKFTVKHFEPGNFTVKHCELM
jgi:hypothetical protein